MSAMLRRYINRAQIGRLARVDVRRPLATFAGWCERSRQRCELTTLIRDGFNFADLGVTRALAVQEAGKYPWQAFDGRWQDVATPQCMPADLTQSNLARRSD